MVKLVKTSCKRAAGTTGAGTTIGNDGITVSQYGSDFGLITANTPFPSISGKYVYEITIIYEDITSYSDNNIGAAFCIATSNTMDTNYIVCESYKNRSSLYWSGAFDEVQTCTTTGGLIIKEGDTVGVGWDLKNGKVSFFINGKLALYTDICYFDKLADVATIYPMIYFYPANISSVTAKVNFGQQKYVYSYDGFMNLYDCNIGKNEISKLKLY